MYERALSLFTKDETVWRPLRNDTVTWNVRTIPTNPLRLAKARTAGTLLALGYTWFACSFHPISFWLSALCVTESFDSLKCTDFISQIDQELANSLRAWPLDPHIPLSSSSSLTVLLANYLNTTVSPIILVSQSYITDIVLQYLAIRNCGPEERILYRNEIFAQALFSASADFIQTDPELQAMKEAFNIILVHNTRLREVREDSSLYSFLFSHFLQLDVWRLSTKAVSQDVWSASAKRRNSH